MLASPARSTMDKAPGTAQPFCVLVSSAQRGSSHWRQFSGAQSCSACFLYLSQKTFADLDVGRKWRKEGLTQRFSLETIAVWIGRGGTL